jgi:hypothetical protein
MASRNRLFFYIVINVIVSALVTIIILFIYDRYFRPELVPMTVANPASGPAATGTEPLEIASVVGVGQLESEIVVVHNTSNASVNLSGWKLKTVDDKNTFTFPQITLHENGAVQIHTAGGNDTAIDLYWNLSRPLWKSGDLVTLTDARGNLIDNYRIP